MIAFAGCGKNEEPIKPSPQPKPQPMEPLWPEGASVVGTVSSEGKGLEGVVVSDGYLFTQTDTAGRFFLNSARKHGYVFISTPSGYEVPSKGVLPQFYAYVGKYKQDTVNFTLTKADQQKYSVYLLGDMHLANKRNDLKQFDAFAKDLNTQSASQKGFVITLGDMSWDAYWDGYNLSNYLNTVNGLFPNLQFFHTIGNHDHELYKVGDWETAVTYKKVIGPTYYSFNAGSVHYIVLDDILCRNTADGKRSSWNEVDDDQLAWLKKDLSYVSKDTPIIVTMHAALYANTGKFYLYNGMDLVKCFSGYDNTMFITGHSHVCYNTDFTHKSGYIPVYEANSGAVCGAWWYTVYDFPKENVHISPDGTPGGYRVLEVDGKNIKWYFKGTGCDASYQMRTYDRNSICMSADKYVPNATEANRKGFLALAADYVEPSSANEVLINIWDWDPTWKIDVTENGNKLQAQQLSGKVDPLYVSSCEAYSFNKGYTTEYSAGVLSSYYPASETNHLFRVKASSATSTLKITLTDRFGRTYSETMTRPKPFRIEY